MICHKFSIVSLAAANYLPSKKDLAHLEEIFAELNAILEPTVSKFNVLREDILRVASDIGYVPKTEQQALVLQKDFHVVPVDLKPNRSEHGYLHNNELCLDDEIEEIRKQSTGVVL